MRYEIHTLTDDGWVNAFGPYGYDTIQYKTKREANEIMWMNIDALKADPMCFKIVKAPTIRTPRRPKFKYVPQPEGNPPDTAQAISWKDLIAEADNAD